MEKELVVKKTFGNLLSGDVIKINTDQDGRIYFYVTNRTRQVRFYGNKKGLWSEENPIPLPPRPKNFVSFIIKTEPIPEFAIMKFSAPPPRPPHPTKEGYTADGTENWDEKYLNKIIEDFEKIGVF